MKNEMKVTIVVVEDEKLIAKSIVNNIEKCAVNCEVIGVAYDGEAGYELVRKLLPNILFTDIKMPVLDGLQLISMVNDNFPFVKIVVVSGYDDFEYARAAIHNNVSDYLLKPINLAELQTTLKNLQNGLVASTGRLHAANEVKNPREIVSLVEEYIHVNYVRKANRDNVSLNCAL